MHSNSRHLLSTMGTTAKGRTPWEPPNKCVENLRQPDFRYSFFEKIVFQEKMSTQFLGNINELFYINSVLNFVKMWKVELYWWSLLFVWVVQSWPVWPWIHLNKKEVLIHALLPGLRIPKCSTQPPQSEVYKDKEHKVIFWYLASRRSFQSKLLLTEAEIAVDLMTYDLE